MPKKKSKPNPLALKASREADDRSIAKILDGNPEGHEEIYTKYRNPICTHIKRFIRTKRRALLKNKNSLVEITKDVSGDDLDYNESAFIITHQDADDRASEAIIQLFELIKSGYFDTTYPIWPLLKKIIENATINYWKKNYSKLVHFPTAGRAAYRENGRTPIGTKPRELLPEEELPKGLHDIYFRKAHEERPGLDGRNIINEMAKIDADAHIDAFLAQLSSTDYDLFKLYYYENKTTKEIAELRNMNDNTVRSHLRRARMKYHEEHPDLDIPPEK